MYRYAAIGVDVVWGSNATIILSKFELVKPDSLCILFINKNTIKNIAKGIQNNVIIDIVKGKQTHSKRKLHHATAKQYVFKLDVYLLIT